MVHLDSDILILIVGYGEIGKSIGKVIGKHDWITTKERGVRDAYKTIHVCIPYSKEFKRVVKQLKSVYPKALVIVHSSVPVGTCDALEVTHSPVIGKHPDLESGIRTFTKYFGGKDAKKAAKIFSDLGIKTKVVKYASDTEAAKLWDTTAYGRMIMLEKEIHAWCKKNKRDFNLIYTEWTKMYNEGYTKLGMSNVTRPVLKHVPGLIGGHCVLPNAKLLKVKL